MVKGIADLTIQFESFGKLGRNRHTARCQPIFELDLLTQLDPLIF